jgi:hypothetical protein
MKRSLAVLAVLLALVPLSSSRAQDCQEEVALETSPGTLSMYHHEAMFNCCAWLDVQVEAVPGSVEFTEWEQFEIGPCYCLCCFDASATVGGLEAGEYVTRVWKALNNGDGTWNFVLAAEDTLVIEGESPPSLVTSYLPWVETVTPEDSDGRSWGTIKALYR